MYRSFTDCINVKELPAESVINHLKERVEFLEKENQKINKEYSDFKSRYNDLTLNDGEKLLCLNIYSQSDDTIDYLIICKNTDKFGNIAKKFYGEHEQEQEKDNAFYYKGNVIDESKSLEDNGIKENSKISLGKKNE